MRYEKAAKIRDRIRAIEETVEKQRIHSMTFVDRDVFGYYMAGKEVYIEVMFIRSGNMEDVASYHFLQIIILSKRCSGPFSINFTVRQGLFRQRLLFQWNL